MSHAIVIMLVQASASRSCSRKWTPF